MKKIILLLLGIIFVSNISAFTIKIGSIAPKDSPWGRALMKLESEWERISRGRIKVTIYHGGVSGGEGAMLRKLKIGQIHVGVFSSIGLNKISPEMLTLSIPFLIRDNDELDYVMDNMEPVFAGLIEDRDYKVLSWSRAGWVRFFSKEPVVYPADLQKLKMAANSDEAAMDLAWKKLGFKPVTVPLAEMLSALNNDKAQALYASPLAAGGYQWFGIANHMADLYVAPFMGAMIMSDKAWKRIPANMRDEFLAVAKEMEEELNQSVINLENEAIKTMSGLGLVINPVPQDALEEWREVFSEAFDLMVGETFDEDIYEQINDHLEEYRSK